MKNLLITGGAGFIGSNFLYFWAGKYPDDNIIVLDALTYAGNLPSISSLIENKSITFIEGDICNAALIDEIFIKHNIDLVVHFAAESHVDRSIVDPDTFIRTNIEGTHTDTINISLPIILWLIIGMLGWFPVVTYYITHLIIFSGSPMSARSFCAIIFISISFALS